jgi:Secretion system C-terminal sorting domain
MRNAFYTLLTLVWMVSIFTTTLFSQDVQDDQKIWSKVFIDQNTFGTGNPDYKWDPPQSVTKTFLFGGGGVTVNPNFRPFPTTNTTQSELSVDVAPFSESIVFASSNATNWPVTTLFGTGVYWTFDGAQTWGGGDVPPFGSNSGDPASAIGTNGFLYENYINNPGGQGISISTDNGASWSTHTVAPNPGSLADKNHMMVDKTTGSPYENRIYVTWTDFGGPNDADVVIRYSSNDGVTWTSSMNISGSLNAGSHSQGTNVQTGPNGEVYVAFAIYDAWPGGEDAIGFAKSTDGGDTWTSARIYQAVNFGLRGSLKPTSIRVASFPSMAVDRSGGPNNGNIYITWPQRGVAPAGSDPDIVMIKSTDGGTTWTSPVRVNDDALNNGKDQYFPWMTVDQSTGQLLFVFYDSRNINNDSSSVWMASSFDAGTTFNNFEVSEQPFKPKPIPGLAGGYQGDYIGIAALNDVAYPYWADDRTGNYQGWMSVVNFGPPCPVDPPSNPNPANGTIDVPITLSQLSWDNGVGASQNELWFGEAGSMTLVHSGSLISSWPIPSTLTYSTSYQWRVVELNDTCSVSGPVWGFTTEPDPDIVIDTLFFDDFESGLGLWTITNDGGDCDWMIFTEPYPNSYTLPATSSGGVLSADSDECGSGTTLLSTASINGSFDFSTYTQMVWLEFDNDWRTIDADDQAIVEMSVDGGATWTSIWERIGVDERNTHEVVDITGQASGEANVQFRLVSVQPGWDWWWTVDNFAVYGMLIVPVELTSFAAVIADGNVQLNWTTATEINNQGFEIQKRTGNGEFEKVGFVPGHGTTTDIQSYSYIDSKVAAGNYTYRLKQIDFNGAFEYSDEVAVDVTTPLEFALEQNYPNPFNPSTVIKYSIPENGFVTLDVYNLLGEKVASLVNGVQEAGRYEVNFNASSLASGIYVYSLKSGSFSSVKKMLLMK